MSGTIRENNPIDSLPNSEIKPPYTNKRKLNNEQIIETILSKKWKVDLLKPLSKIVTDYLFKCCGLIDDPSLLICPICRLPYGISTTDLSLKEYAYPDDKIKSIEYIGNDKIAYSNYSEIKVIDMNTGNCLMTMKVEGVSHIRYIGNDMLISRDWYSPIRLWNLNTGKCLDKFPGHITCCFTNCGKNKIASGGYGILRIIDIKTKEIKTIKIGIVTSLPNIYPPQIYKIHNIICVGNNKIATSGFIGGDIFIWDITGEKLLTLDPGGERAQIAYIGGIEMASSTKNTVKIWDIETGACLREINNVSKLNTCLKRLLNGKRCVRESDMKCIGKTNNFFGEDFCYPFL